MVTNVSFLVTTWLFARSFMFDISLKDYNAPVTNVLDFSLVLVGCIIVRCICDANIDQQIYKTSYLPIPSVMRLAIQGRVILYTLAPIVGMFIAIYVKSSNTISSLWMLVTFVSYFYARLTTYGAVCYYSKAHSIREMFKYQSSQSFKDVLKFHMKFLHHDIINFLLGGIYGVVLVPYKRTTERYYLTK